jgi:BASS family bile acid:Na+ symporter
MNPAVELAIRALVFLVMVTVGMDLRLRDFQRVRDHPRLVPGVVIGHWVALLITGGLISRALALPDEVTGGVLLVAAAPAAALSCFYAQLAAGDLALATTLAAVSSALAFVATPLAATIGFQLFLGSSGQFDLPIASVAQ